MQKFRTLAAFFLVEKQQPQREREKERKKERKKEREIMPSTMVTTSSAQRRSDQNNAKYYGHCAYASSHGQRMHSNWTKIQLHIVN